MNEIKLSCRLVKESKISWQDGTPFIKFLVVHFPDEGETVALHCEMDHTPKDWERIQAIPLGSTIGITGMITKRKDRGIIIGVVEIRELI